MGFFNQILVKEVSTDKLIDITDLDKDHYEAFLDVVNRLQIAYQIAVRRQNVSTSEKDLRVCEVIASAWISVKERLPESEEHIVLFYDGRVDFGWYSHVRSVFYSGAYERDVTHWMPMPCPPAK